MSLYENDYCPKCKRLTVYSERDDTGWAVGCSCCGFGTDRFPTWREARAEGEKLKEQINE